MFNSGLFCISTVDVWQGSFMVHLTVFWFSVNILTNVKSFCVPLLTYCIGAINASDQQVKDLAVFWNDSFRRIFGYSFATVLW